jgi:thiol:disulfide interchange protein DsbD
MISQTHTKFRVTSYIKIITAIFFQLFIFAFTAMANDDFLDPRDAFVLQLTKLDEHTLQARWKIAPGYHLYKDRIQFLTGEKNIQIGLPNLPKGKIQYDENFQKEVETYEQSLTVNLPLHDIKEDFLLDVHYQGCADKGLCYPPEVRQFKVTLGENVQPIEQLKNEPSAPKRQEQRSLASNQDDTSLAQKTLASGDLAKIGIGFLVFGLLLSFTPCVLPMVPILSSIIVGEKNVTRMRGFLLALAYCLGMALIYTSLGIAAGLAGEGLAGALQKPWVLIGFASLLFLLALSMFDVYQLQLPSALQGRLSETSGRLGGGRFFTVFFMGALSALIVGPCVAGPLAGALLYISQTKNVMIGAWALFSMAMGMSVPLLLTGISAGSLLPRAGAWMNHVKKIFGLLLFAVALWMLNPILSNVIAMLLWGAFAIFSALILGVFEPISSSSTLTRYAAKMLSILCLLLGFSQVVGALSGGQDLMQPLGHLQKVVNAAAQGTIKNDTHAFERIKTVQELERILTQSKQPILLDFYAEWCIACKEMERFTFSDPKVASQLKQMKLLQVDVTNNTVEDRELMKRFNLFGPPGVILFTPNGLEALNARIVGYLDAKAFSERLETKLGVFAK